MSVWTGLTQPMGIDLFCIGKKFLVFNLISRNLKIKYRRSALGVFWTLLTPLAMAGVYYFVFKIILNVRIEHYPVFILSGVLPWGFFSQSVAEGMESIVGNWGLVAKIPIPIQVFPYTGVLTNFITLLLSMPILIGVALAEGVSLSWSMALLPLYLVALFIMAYAIALIIGILFVLLRDLRHIFGIVTQLWFYATPVLYHIDMVPERYKGLVWLNPLSHVFTGIRRIMIDGGWPSSAEAAHVAGWAFLLVGAALYTHRKLAPGLVEQI